jgi:pilus assembly protein Flp/PilA
MLKYLVYLQNLVTEQVRRDDRGATAVEYGLIVALIAGAIVITVATVGNDIRQAFNNALQGW